jgi:hypothetical protein
VSNLAFTSAPLGVAETITLSSGTSGDTFNFEPTSGMVTIKGYVPGSESLDFSHSVFANPAALELHVTSSGGGANTIITLDASDVITLTGVTVANFEAHSSDWHFI